MSVETIERVAGQIGEPQKASRDVGARIDSRLGRFRDGVGLGVGDAVRCSIGVGIDNSGHPNLA